MLSILYFTLLSGLLLQEPLKCLSNCLIINSGGHDLESAARTTSTNTSRTRETNFYLDSYAKNVRVIVNYSGIF